LISVEKSAAIFSSRSRSASCPTAWPDLRGLQLATDRGDPGLDVGHGLPRVVAAQDAIGDIPRGAALAFEPL